MQDFPNDENGDVLRRMRDRGDDLAEPRTIDFSVLFSSEAGALEFKNAVAKFDAVVIRVVVDNRETLPLWDVTVEKFMLPTHEGITAFEDEIGLIAAPLGGHNDGWGCFQIKS